MRRWSGWRQPGQLVRASCGAYFGSRLVSGADFAWLAGVRESLIAANPKRLELLKTGIASCAIALKLAELGPVGGVPGGGRFELTEG